jgi:hypothetical protein
LSTRLPSGLLIYNSCKHSLHFWTEEGVVSVQNDEAINAKTTFNAKFPHNTYSLVSALDLPTQRGLEIIRRIREEEPEALIVGSVIAARVYKRDVVSVHLLKPDPKYNTELQLCSSDLFIVHLGD